MSSTSSSARLPSAVPPPPEAPASSSHSNAIPPGHDAADGVSIAGLVALSCTMKTAGQAASGGVMGGLFGVAQGVLKSERTFKSVLAEGASSAKTFAIMSGVHTGILCCMEIVRKKQDPINSGVAGFGTGVALAWGGTPMAILQNAAGFAVFSYLIEMVSKPQPAVALTLDLPLHTSSRLSSSGRKQPLSHSQASFQRRVNGLRSRAARALQADFPPLPLFSLALPFSPSYKMLPSQIQ